MKILGVGLNNTAISSLHRALRLLGLSSLRHDDQRLREVFCQTEQDRDFRLYDDVDAVLDIPSACFYEELLAAYPGCKCILTVRAETDWWNGTKRHFNSNMGKIGIDHDSWERSLRNFVYGSSHPNEHTFRKRYREHNDRVIQSIPGDQLLVLDISAGDGWEKLCPFLGVEEPAMPFPGHVTDEQVDTHSGTLVANEIEAVIPTGSVFILVDDNPQGTDSVAGRTILPFLERDGKFWGRIADDKTAIEELHRLRGRGASHIVFAGTAFWWLEHYSGLSQYVSGHFSCTYRNDRSMIFDLQRYSKEALLHRCTSKSIKD